MPTRLRPLIIAVLVPVSLIAPAGMASHGTTGRGVRDAAGRLTFRDMRIFPLHDWQHHRHHHHRRAAAHGGHARGHKKGRPRKRPRPQPTAAARFHWGRPTASDDFRSGRLDRRSWEVYNGPGQGGAGHRSPRAVSVRKGVLTITGRSNGTTGGVAWKRGAQRTGRWEARVRMSRANAAYHPVLLLWPTHARGGAAPRGGGGEVDWLEVADDGTRQKAKFFLHYGPLRRDNQLVGQVRTDMTRWHAFAVEWTATWVSGFVDGRRWFHTTRRAAIPRGPMGQTIQLDWFPHDARHTARGIGWNAPATFQVDWIRMYRR
ncbi:glycoside hydrolase family 16 protein [Spirillospora sp. NPDC049652]